MACPREQCVPLLPVGSGVLCSLSYTIGAAHQAWSLLRECRGSWQEKLLLRKVQKPQWMPRRGKIVEIMEMNLEK
jgi:hypothetical protein